MQNGIKKVILITQIIRSLDCLKNSWFYNLFEYYVKKTTGLPVYTLLPPDCENVFTENYIPFDIDKFYSFYGIEEFTTKDIETQNSLWAKIYYNNEFNKEAYEYIHSIFDGTLVISHELEQVVVNILEYYNIPYVDINTDPIRYLDDQLFSFRSNNEKVYTELLKYKADEELFYQYANYIKTANFMYAQEHIEGNAVLFVGQTECDKTLIDTKNNEIYSILNHKEEFKNSVKGFDKIYYKRHPMVKNDEEIINFIKSLSEIEIIEDNFYKLMCRKDIKKVVSISSGTCIEAKYFGKNVQTLLRESIELQKENTFDKCKYITINQDFLRLAFWSRILKPIVDTKDFEWNLGFSEYQNKLRNSRGIKCYWGFEDLNQEVAKFDVMQHVWALQSAHSDMGAWLLRVNDDYGNWLQTHETRLNEIERRAGEVERRAGEVERKAGELEQKERNLQNHTLWGFCLNIIRTFKIFRYL